MWREASFFGRIRISRGFGIGNEFPVLEGPHRYDLKFPSVKRAVRYPADTTPTFVLTGETAKPDPNLRGTYARMLTSHPQFARATTNLIWAELMGIGIFDPPHGFDLDRQNPDNPPPEPWTLQPTHPKLLEALAQDFVASNYSLRHLIKTITKSSAYQLSSQFPGEWEPRYASYFARRFVRRLPAEQLYDAIAKATGVYEEIKVAGTDETVKYVVQARCLLDLDEEVKDLLVTLFSPHRSPIWK